MSGTLADRAPCPVCARPCVRVPVTRATEPADFEHLCEAVTAAIAAGAPTVVLCDAQCPIEPDMRTVNAVGKLHLSARRNGGAVEICARDADLRGLLRFAGLSEVIAAPASAD